jgi:hypothetical protein
MAYPAGVRPWRIKEFANAHKNFKQPLDENQSYDLFINDENFRRLDPLSQYMKCTENLQWVIGDAMAKSFAHNCLICSFYSSVQIFAVLLSSVHPSRNTTLQLPSAHQRCAHKGLAPL